jgi:hypothetical protein
MPVSFRILPRFNLIIATYSGFAGLEETIERAAECARHPDFNPAMRHLIDVSRVVEVERDFPRFFAMQGKVMEDFPPIGNDQMFVFYAPTRPGQEMAQMVRKSWDGLDWAVVVALEDEAQVLTLLGLPGDSIASLAEQAV